LLLEHSLYLLVFYLSYAYLFVVATNFASILFYLFVCFFYLLLCASANIALLLSLFVLLSLLSPV
jgi:hypothetical protein